MSDQKEYFGEYPWWLRLTVLPWYIWLALIVTAIWATSALSQEAKPATLVAIVDDNRLFLFQDACPLGGWFSSWKRAQWFYEGKPVEACWKPQRHGDGHVYADTVDADGDAGAIPMVMFRKSEGV